MAIEAMNMAAVTYQGRVSGAAEQKIKAAKEPSAKQNETQVSTDRSEENTSEPDIRLFEPQKENKGEKKEFSGGSQHNNMQLQQAVEKFKKSMNQTTEAVFGIHEGTNRVMIKIVDKETKDIIKEYPPEQTLDMIQKVWEMAGIMVDEKL